MLAAFKNMAAINYELSPHLHLDGFHHLLSSDNTFNMAAIDRMHQTTTTCEN
jgi:hypothetical protein